MPTFSPYPLLVLSFKFSPGMGRGFVCSTDQIGSKWALSLQSTLIIGMLFAFRKYMAIGTIFCGLSPSGFLGGPFSFRVAWISKVLIPLG